MRFDQQHVSQVIRLSVCMIAGAHQSYCSTQPWHTWSQGSHSGGQSLCRQPIVFCLLWIRCVVVTLPPGMSSCLWHLNGAANCRNFIITVLKASRGIAHLPNPCIWFEMSITPVHFVLGSGLAFKSHPDYMARLPGWKRGAGGISEAVTFGRHHRSGSQFWVIGYA